MSTRDAWRRPELAVALVLVAGAALRLTYPGDIEYKEDERYTFNAVLHALHGGPWPPLGMNAGAGYLKNAGFSVWAFILLGKIFRVATPVDLARTVQWTSILALAALAFFSLRVVDRAQREPWLWGLALACVNPFDVILERKIWPPSLFPLVALALLVGWWFRGRRAGAFAWGLAGAMLGQLEMAGGFFVALSYVIGTLAATRGRGVRWGAWLAGSLVGVIPLVPWLLYMWSQRASGLDGGAHDFYVAFSMAHHPLSQWMDLAPGQFWWVWLTGLAGVGLDYSYYGLVWRVLSSPLLGGRWTYLCSVASATAALAVVAILVRSASSALRQRTRIREWIRRLVGLSPADDTWLSTTIGVFWFGALFTMSPFFFHRHYLLASFPLPGVWLARTALGAPGTAPPGRVARSLLAAVVAATLAVSVLMLADIHAHRGVAGGDFGRSYRSSLVPHRK